MVLNFIAVGAVGLLIGLFFRAPALIAATFITVIVHCLLAGGGGVFTLKFLFSTLLLVVCLQCGYLLGLMLMTLRQRRKSSH